jgi:thioredoxin 2
MRAQLVRCRHCGRRNRLPDAGPGIPRCGHCRNPLPWITDAGDDDFAEIADGSTIAVLVDIWAPWCPLCSRANLALDRLAGLLAGQVKLVKVNAAHTPGLVQRFVVESVPTLMVLRGGPLVAAYRGGGPPEPSLRGWLQQTSQAVITRPVPVRKAPGRC